MGEQKFPEPTAGAIIVNKNEKILLIRSHKWQNRYVIPGGHIELGETMKQALTREIKEETGLDIYDIEYLEFQEFIHDPGFWKKKHFIFFDFVCRTNGTEVTLNEEGQEYVWVSLEEAFKLEIEPYTIKTLNAYKKRLEEKD